MESKRQHKFARMIQKEIGEIFQRDAKSLFGHAFITVTQVRISPDLSVANIYLSIMMVSDKQAFIKDLTDKKSMMRKLLGERIGKIARIIPDLHFFIDDSVDYAQHIENILKNLNESSSKPKN